jgi:hypothetical protein
MGPFRQKGPNPSDSFYLLVKAVAFFRGKSFSVLTLFTKKAPFFVDIFLNT